MINRCFEAIRAILDQVEATQAAHMEAAAHMLAEATQKGKRLYAFGSNHAGSLATELYYRTGGLANFELISLPGLRLDMQPPNLTSRMEGIEGYGRVMLDAYPMEVGDVLVIHSVSGKNVITVDVALSARERGARIIALTNVTLSGGLSPSHPTGKRLFELADVVIDNCGGDSDAMLWVDGCAQRVGPSSTAVGAVILNAVVARTVQILVERQVPPPVLASCNAEGGNEYNLGLFVQRTQEER